MCGILIVDDDASIRFAMADYFAAKGHRALSVGSAEEVESQLAAGHYGIVITDLRLTSSGDAEGLEIVRRVSERHHGTVCIVLTAYGSPESEATARRYGASAFLHKPRPMADLLEIVERLVPPGDVCPMSGKCDSSAACVAAVPPNPDVTDVVDNKEPSMTYQTSDEIVELIWRDLSGQVERPRVAEVAREIAAGFGDVKITTFVPLFVRRLSVDRLRPEAGQRG